MQSWLGTRIYWKPRG